MYVARLPTYFHLVYQKYSQVSEHEKIGCSQRIVNNPSAIE